MTPSRRSTRWWPWTLTPSSLARWPAWLLGLGVVLGSAAWANDQEGIRIATWSYVVLGVLQLVAVARYPGDTVSYLAFLLLLVGTGSLGILIRRADAVAGQSR